MALFLQTIFEINSNSKTNASVVMRAKRSRDMRLVDMFTQKKEVLAAEGRYHVPVTPLPSTHHTADQEDSEEEDFQVSTTEYPSSVSVFHC